jgi:agmatinase
MSTPQNQQPNSKAEKIANFDPNGVGDVNAGIFGLPFTVDEAEVVIIPVPWEVTVSYSAGTAQGPKAVLDASPQLDLFEPAIKDAWKAGIAMEEISEEWHAVSDELRVKAEEYITWLEEGQPDENSSALANVPEEVTAKGEELLQWLKQKALNYMDQGKSVGLLGGDHSTPLGLIHAMADRYEEFGILQLDAHADLRVAYEGFKYSHASIMYNALQLPQVKKLVQVGIRDLCQAEAEMAEQSNGRIAMFYDAVLKENMYSGDSWKKECKKIIAQLPQKVYVSFDIDALDPKLCPGTGTPVPGGLEFEEAVFLIKQLVKSGREIIGFDLNEVSPGDTEWNGNVGARMLYKLCNLMAVSQGKLKAEF